MLNFDLKGVKKRVLHDLDPEDSPPNPKRVKLNNLSINMFEQCRLPLPWSKAIMFYSICELIYLFKLHNKKQSTLLFYYFEYYHNWHHKNSYSYLQIANIGQSTKQTPTPHIACMSYHIA